MSARINKAFFYVSCLGLSACLTGCESANNGGSLPDLPPDTTAPEISATVPTISVDDEPSESDQNFSIFFSELLDEASVVNSTPNLGASIKASLRYAPDARNTDLNNDAPVIETADISIVVDDYLRNISDPVTELPTDILSTLLRVQSPNNGYDLDAYYTLKFEQSIKDRSSELSINPISGVEEQGNFLADDAEYRFITNAGQWRDEQALAMPSDLEVQAFTTSEREQSYLLWSDRDNTSQQFTNRLAKYDLASKQWQSINNETLSEANIATFALPNQGDPSRASFQLQVAELSNAHVASAWLQIDSASQSLNPNFQVFDGTSWQVVTGALSSGQPSTELTEYRLLANSDRFITFWVERDGNLWQLYHQTLELNPSASQYLAGTPTKLYESNQALDNLDIHSLGQGFVVAWRENQGFQMHAYSGTGTLANTQYLQTPSSQASQNLTMHFNAVGEGYVTWQQFDGQRQNIWRSRVAQQRFSTPELVETNDLNETLNGATASCVANNSTIFWLANNNGRWNLLSSQFSNENGWSEPRTQDTLKGTDINLQVRYDDSCNLHASWQDQSNQALKVAYFSSVRGTWSTLTNPDIVPDTQAGFSSQSSLIKLGGAGRFMNIRLVNIGGRKQLSYSLYDE